MEPQTEDQKIALDKAFQNLAHILTECNDEALVKDFLSCLLTQKEILDISGRWELVNRIAQGETQRKVSQDLGISLCKITRGSKELKKEGSAFKRMLLLDKKHS